MRLAMALVVTLGTWVPVLGAGPVPDYERDVAPVLKKFCAGCHNNDDHEGEFSVESFDEIQKGGEHGAAILPGDPGPAA